MVRPFHEVAPGADPSSLLAPDIVEKSRGIQQLKDQFKTMLPNRFGNIRTYISPVPFIKSVIRADCQNKGCGVRAFIHIQRNIDWEFADAQPKFDRLQNAKCSECIEMKA